MRLRGMAIAAVAALAACSPSKNNGPKQGTVIVAGTASQDGMAGATKTVARTAGTVGVAAATEVADPSKLQLTVFKTELFDGTSWITIFESPSGTAVDLVANAGGLFGQGTVPAGTYGKIRFTVATQASFSAAALGTCAAATDATFPIDATVDAQTQLYFATAALGGNASWSGNGKAEYPYLVSVPIEVRDAATTRVTLQFDTSGTVSCTQDGLRIPHAPLMHAYSVVIPKVQSFTGGEYWVAHYNATSNQAPSYDLNTAQGRADYRRSAGSNLGWGLKAKFSPPMEDGVGLLKLSGGMTESRRSLDETGCTECGYQAPSPGDQYLVYSIDADRRVSFTVPGGPSIVGAFSESFDTLIGATIEGDRGSSDLMFGVEASTAPQTVTGRYAWSWMGNEFRYPADSFVASGTYTGWAFGWGKIDGASSPDLGQYMSEFEFTYPTLAYGNGGFFWTAGTKPIVGDYLPDSVAFDATGVGSLSLGGGVAAPQWTVATPNGGRVMLTVGDKTVSDRDAGADTKYDQNVAVMLKQAAPGTHSLASLAGRWTVVTRTNELSHFGDDVVGFRGVEYGTVTVGANGTASFEVVRVDDGGNVLSDSGTASIRVQKACIGRVGGAGEGGTALAWNDATCAADGGDVLDVAALYVNDNGTSRDVAWFVVDESGSVATMVSTDGYDPARSANGPFMIGYMVRASR